MEVEAKITRLTISAASANVYRSEIEYAPSHSFGNEGISKGKDCVSTMCQCITFCMKVGKNCSI